MIQLDGREALGLFVLLKGGAADEDEILQGLMNRLERVIYDRLSVEEVENLPLLYRKNPDLLKNRE